ncbi:MAG: hypothetical protein Pyrs2KO_21210 [Pyruvatibacter sp.]
MDTMNTMELALQRPQKFSWNPTSDYVAIGSDNVIYMRSGRTQCIEFARGGLCAGGVVAHVHTGRVVYTVE